MYPNIYILNYEISTYDLLVVSGLFAFVIFAIRWNYRLGPKYPIGLGIMLLGTPFCYIFGRLSYYFFLSCSALNMEKVFDIQRGGFMFIGAFIGAILGGTIYFEIKNIPRLGGIEIFIPYLPIAGILGRLGCFFTGCCYGEITDSFLGICFPKGSHVWYRHVRERLISEDQFFSLPVHPTQLYEIGMWIIMGIILMMIRGCKPRRGVILLSFLCLYFLMRFIKDFFRADYTMVLWQLDLMQVLALLVVPLSIIGIMIIYRDRILPLKNVEEIQG